MENPKPTSAYNVTNQLIPEGISSVMTPSAKAENCITRAAFLTRWGSWDIEWKYMFPQSATRVMPIICIDQFSSAFGTRPSNWLKNPGSARSAIALSPNTIAPVRRVSLRGLSWLFASITNDVIAELPLI